MQIEWTFTFLAEIVAATREMPMHMHSAWITPLWTLNGVAIWMLKSSKKE